MRQCAALFCDLDRTKRTLSETSRPGLRIYFQAIHTGNLSAPIAPNRSRLSLLFPKNDTLSPCDLARESIVRDSRKRRRPVQIVKSAKFVSQGFSAVFATRIFGKLYDVVNLFAISFYHFANQPTISRGFDTNRWFFFRDTSFLRFIDPSDSARQNNYYGKMISRFYMIMWNGKKKFSTRENYFSRYNIMIMKR